MFFVKELVTMHPTPHLTTAALGALLVLATACASDPPKPPVTPTPTATATAPAVAKTPPPPVVGTPEPVSQNVNLDSEIMRLCNIHVEVAQTSDPAAPRFEFDQSTLTAQDKAVLDQVATCMIKGPLAGRHVKLIGRADPRGTGEYNFVLGGSRAHTVSHYLEEQGVESPRLNETSRGSLDATGTDDATWANDRRVDIVLGS
jgi:peptidoglycan-associated lipoprotein